MHSSALFVGFHGVDAYAAALDGLAPGLFAQIVDSVLVAQAHGVVGREARLETAVGLSRLLAAAPALVADPARAGACTALLTTLVALVEPVAPTALAGGSTNVHSFFEERDQSDLVVRARGGRRSGREAPPRAPRFAEPPPPPHPIAGRPSPLASSPPLRAQEDAVASEYTAAFSQLIFAREKGRYAFRGRAEPKAAVAQALAAAAAAGPPGALAKLVDASPAAVTLRAYVAAAGLPAL